MQASQSPLNHVRSHMQAPASRLRALLRGVMFVLVLFGARPAGAETYVWSTFAGNGSAGSTNGVGASAKFGGPDGITVDANGTLYVADTSNHTIRKITPARVVSTLAGSPGSIGSSDGTGAAARFYYPVGVGVDGEGNLYVNDCVNFTLRKITPSGVVTTLAGLAGSWGSTNGSGSNARFSGAEKLAMDGNGNSYVTDWNNHTIRKVSSAGLVSTIAGLAESPGSVNGAGAAARFNHPWGLL